LGLVLFYHLVDCKHQISKSPFFYPLFDANLMASSCVASIIRLYALYNVSHSTDQSWDNAVIVIWSCIELNTGVICVGLGSLKPLISRYLPGFLGSSHANEVSNAYRRRSRYMRRLDEEGLPSGADVEFSDNFVTRLK